MRCIGRSELRMILRISKLGTSHGEVPIEQPKVPFFQAGNGRAQPLRRRVPPALFWWLRNPGLRINVRLVLWLRGRLADRL